MSIQDENLEILEIKEKRKVSFQIIVIFALILNVFVLMIGFFGVYRMLNKVAVNMPSNLEFLDAKGKQVKAGVMFLPQLEQRPQVGSQATPQATPLVSETPNVENSEITE